MSDFNILIIDDDPEDHAFISAAINTVIPEAKIKSYFDGVELANFWFEDALTPDLILLDLNMQIVDGKTALKNIKQDNALKNIPVVILTSNFIGLKKQELSELGADDFYIKPCTAVQMEFIIQKIKGKWITRIQPQT
jgi:CheY-like chemotaxis protein